MDSIFGQLDDAPQSDDGLTPSQRTVLAYIQQNSNITQDELQAKVTSLSGDDIAAALQFLLSQALIIEEKLRGGSVYRVSSRRAKRRGSSMDQVWGALDDSGQATRSTINPEARRTRSNLTEGIFARLDESPASSQAVAKDEQTATYEQSLMADLTKTGQSTMRKRAEDEPPAPRPPQPTSPPPDEPKAATPPPSQAEVPVPSAPPDHDATGSDLMRDLSNAGRKTRQYSAAQLQSGKDKRKQEKKGFMGRLRGWLGDDE